MARRSGEPPAPHFDVVVVGGGVVGGTLAHALARQGRATALVEERALGEGTSGSSFAWINATSKSGDEAYHRLNARGAAGYRQLAVEWGEDAVGVHPCGMLEWAEPADRVRVTALRERLERLQAWGYPAAWVTEGELRALEPHVEFAAGAAGLHAFADAWLDVPTYAGFLKRALAACGVTVLDGCTAHALALSETGAVRGVETSRGRLAAPHVVVAAGASTPETLARLTGFDAYRTRFPLRRAAGLLVRTPPLLPFRLARRILYSAAAGHFHLRPTSDAGLLLGADDTDGAAAEWEGRSGRVEPESCPPALREAARGLLERARAVLPRFPGSSLLERCEIRVGVRPVPADGLTIAGPVPGSEGLHLAVTHSGVTLAPALGELLARTIATGAVPAELAPFGFGRFQTPR